MIIMEAEKIIDHYQKWRTGKVEELIYSPEDITKAIDIVMEKAKLFSKNIKGFEITIINKGDNKNQKQIIYTTDMDAASQIAEIMRTDGLNTFVTKSFNPL